ncbi:MAG TPA: LytTR family DNA-binding domain-containing protein [Ferruginibacter sp.]|nr:LytTR family DNA-binding domain-containing protein [Ferruginibacter sp.]
MKVVIIEDEIHAAKRLAKLLRALSDDIEVVQQLDSIASAVNYFEKGPMPDLIFMDIQLADGLSFDIFYKAKIKAPVIFTTAFDQYSLKAFKVNSINYLLKPIDENELSAAVEKHRQLYHKKENDFSETLMKFMHEMNASKFKERLLVKRGQQLSYVKTDATAFCYADGKLCYAVDFSNNKHLLENNLTQLEEQLQPNKFYRINRHLLVNIDAIKKVHTWLGGRLKLEINPSTTAETVVSRERVNGFKEWLGQ